jgi:hypothetical protein
VGVKVRKRKNDTGRRGIMTWIPGGSLQRMMRQYALEQQLAVSPRCTKPDKPGAACPYLCWASAACWHGSHDMNTTPRVADSEGGHTPRRQGRAGASPGPAADPTAGREKQINMELNWIQACQACPVVTSARVSRREWAGRGPRLGRADKLET